MAINKIPKNADGPRAPFAKRTNTGAFVDQQYDRSWGNGYEQTFLDNVGPQVGNEVPVIHYDSDNQFRFGGSVQNPVREAITCHLYPNANQVTQTFFVNPTNRTLQITGLNAIFTTAGTVAGASAYISHECLPLGATTQQAPGTGPNVMGSGVTFNLHGTAATLQPAAGASGGLGAYYHLESRNISVANSTPGTGLIVLQPGDSLSIVFAGTLTTLVGVTITLYVAPGSKYHFVSYYLSANAAAASTSLMTAMRPRTLMFAGAIWGTASTGATTTLDVTKDASGTAPGAGTSVLSATANLKLAANTYTQLGLTATAANLSFNATDSVAVKIGGTTTTLAGVCVTLAFSGNQNEVQIDYNGLNSTVGTNEEFFIADRDYEVVDFAGKWSTVSTSNTSGLTVDTGTQTPGTGQVVQTDNTNAGFLTSGTINIPVFATLSTVHTRFLRAGDRLGMVNAGTLGSLAGFQLSARLMAR